MVLNTWNVAYNIYMVKIPSEFIPVMSLVRAVLSMLHIAFLLGHLSQEISFETSLQATTFYWAGDFLISLSLAKEHVAVFSEQVLSKSQCLQ